MNINFIYRLTAIILSFSQLHYAFASSASSEDLSPAVRKTQLLGQTIHDTADISEVQRKVPTLRKRIGNVSGTHILNRAEKKAVIKAIAQTEAAMMLVDGNYNFHFMPDYVSSTTCSPAQQIHRATVFAIARASQILVENRNATDADIRALIQRDLNSRHMPHWMREAYARSKMLRTFNYRVELFEHTALESLPLARSRLEERAAEQRRNLRPKFAITFKEKHKEDVKAAHDGKGLPFAEAAFPLGRHEFEAFAISPDGACAFYGCQGPYGYFNRKDFGDQIVDNIDTDETLESYTRNSIMYDKTVQTDLRPLGTILPDLPTYEELEPQNFIPDFTVFKGEDIDIEATNAKEKDYFIETIYPRLQKILTKEKLKEVVRVETTRFFKTSFQSWLTYIDLIAYLNNLNIYEFSFTYRDYRTLFEPGDTIYLNKPENFHVARPTARKTFLVANGDHVTRLVPVENTVENLVEWVKAKAHEERRGTRIDAGYKRTWMKGDM